MIEPVRQLGDPTQLLAFEYDRGSHGIQSLILAADRADS